MIDSFAAQKLISQHRGNAVVVTHFTTNREWPQVTTHPDLDLPSGQAMGKASSLGLGLALALPSRKIIVLDGDGSLLSNLGSLVTIASMAPPNLVHFLFHNNVYRTTGGQPIPNAGKVSFTGLAEAAGYVSVHQFSDLASLENNIEKVLNQDGPTFICLEVPPATERPPFPRASITDVVPRFRAALKRPAR